MRYVRPFDPAALAPGTSGKWLLSEEDGAGVIVRLARGGGGDVAPTARDGVERFALVLQGKVGLRRADDIQEAAVGELGFIPAGQSGAFIGDADAIWAEIEAPLQADAPAAAATGPKVIPVDQSKFEGTGFAYQSLIDRLQGASTVRMNVLQVQPGSGSPDWHIHAFAQIYLIQDGEMTIDIGRSRFTAGKNTLVFLPAGLVHRNFNASGAVERHVSLLVPEPKEGEIFDFAVTIHPNEAELLTAVPA